MLREVKIKTRLHLWLHNQPLCYGVGSGFQRVREAWCLPFFLHPFLGVLSCAHPTQQWTGSNQAQALVGQPAATISRSFLYNPLTPAFARLCLKPTPFSLPRNPLYLSNRSGK